jgi:hypothetical protein
VRHSKRGVTWEEPELRGMRYTVSKARKKKPERYREIEPKPKPPQKEQLFHDPLPVEYVEMRKRLHGKDVGGQEPSCRQQPSC